jgi:hypothetical protein
MSELTRRYVVMALATAAPFDPTDRDAAFVLKPWKDPAALRALAAYRDNCYPELARDLDAWIRAIEAGPAARGDVGRRNEPHARNADPGHARRGARPRAPRPKSRGPLPRASAGGHPRPKPGSRHPLPKRHRRKHRP